MSTDITYDNPRAAIWSFLELSTGTVAACLPAFRPVLVKLVPHIFTTSSQSGPTQAREQYCMEHGVSLQSSHTKTKAYTGSRADSESTQDLGFLRNDEYGAWDRDEVSIRQLS